ncbi:hypothetical protein CEUSTIGMA_g4793.t1 [Chlamydomonas eustigma]|uniref:Uncharacterized protein n=1 Tax=Chlamydomonas eustigma TaxID=1157962 RepID=A0A250X2P8_9CHLO|nr:hypothetical protein CEUSTIGMA_g4793.t1 [Chlamydomonas eustigma]|eukprot:GAX77347.1 hypothetical protein CEUSTIGMA_g4793.t1 [Chlamydomonas eustigma]
MGCGLSTIHASTTDNAGSALTDTGSLHPLGDSNVDNYDEECMLPGSVDKQQASESSPFHCIGFQFNGADNGDLIANVNILKDGMPPASSLPSAPNRTCERRHSSLMRNFPAAASLTFGRSLSLLVDDNYIKTCLNREESPIAQGQLDISVSSPRPELKSLSSSDCCSAADQTPVTPFSTVVPADGYEIHISGPQVQVVQAIHDNLQQELLVDRQEKQMNAGHGRVEASVKSHTMTYPDPSNSHVSDVHHTSAQYETTLLLLAASNKYSKPSRFSDFGPASLTSPLQHAAATSIRKRSSYLDNLPGQCSLPHICISPTRAVSLKQYGLKRYDSSRLVSDDEASSSSAPSPPPRDNNKPMSLRRIRHTMSVPAADTILPPQRRLLEGSPSCNSSSGTEIAPVYAKYSKHMKRMASRMEVFINGRVSDYSSLIPSASLAGPSVDPSCSSSPAAAAAAAAVHPSQQQSVKLPMISPTEFTRRSHWHEEDNAVVLTSPYSSRPAREKRASRTVFHISSYSNYTLSVRLQSSLTRAKFITSQRSPSKSRSTYGVLGVPP